MPEGHKKHRYKLVYFQGKGRGEPIRLIFHHFGVDFDDIRLSQEEWQAHKQLKSKMNTTFLSELGGDGGEVSRPCSPKIVFSPTSHIINLF